MDVRYNCFVWWCTLVNPTVGWYPEKITALSVNVSSKLTNDRSIVLLFAHFKFTLDLCFFLLYQHRVLCGQFGGVRNVDNSLCLCTPFDMWLSHKQRCTILFGLVYKFVVRTIIFWGSQAWKFRALGFRVKTIFWLSIHFNVFWRPPQQIRE